MRKFLNKLAVVAMVTAACLTVYIPAHTQNNKVSANETRENNGMNYLLKGVHYPGCDGHDEQCAFIVEGYCYELHDSDVNVTVDVDVPSHYAGYNIVGIAPKAFFNYDNIKTLTIPYLGATGGYIGESAAEGCSNLESLKISSVYTIEENAFKDCTSLKDVDIKEARTFSVGVFYNCTALENVTLPENMYFVNNEMFYNCVSLESIRLPEKICGVSKSGFEGCTKLKDINLPTKAKYIGESAFKNCESLEKITINAPECNIFDSPETIDSHAVIYGYPNSTAQAYAEKYGRKFVETGRGDVNGDGKINNDDLFLLQKSVAAKETLNDWQFSCADINRDEDLNVFDVIAMRRKLIEFEKDNQAECRKAYIEKCKKAEAENPDYKYDLIDVDGDITPELVIDNPGHYVSLYTFYNGKLCTLMSKRSYGRYGDFGFEYKPSENYIHLRTITNNGFISNDQYYEISAIFAYKKDIDLHVITTLTTLYFDDKNGNKIPDDEELKDHDPDNVTPTYYKYNNKISKWEFDSYNKEPYEKLSGKLDFDEICKKLS